MQNYQKYSSKIWRNVDVQLTIFDKIIKNFKLLWTFLDFANFSSQPAMFCRQVSSLLKRAGKYSSNVRKPIDFPQILETCLSGFQNFLLDLRQFNGKNPGIVGTLHTNWKFEIWKRNFSKIGIFVKYLPFFIIFIRK